MEILIIGIAVAFNVIVILIKGKLKRYMDAGLDFAVLCTLSLVFGGTYSGLVAATIASFIVSLYLFVSPPKLDFSRFKPP